MTYEHATQFALIIKVTCSLPTEIAPAGRIIRPVFNKQWLRMTVTAAWPGSTQINVLLHPVWNSGGGWGGVGCLRRTTDASRNSMCPAEPHEKPPCLPLVTSPPGTERTGLRLCRMFIQSYSSAMTTKPAFLAVSSLIFPWGLTGESSAAWGSGVSWS